MKKPCSWYEAFHVAGKLANVVQKPIRTSANMTPSARTSARSSTGVNQAVRGLFAMIGSGQAEKSLRESYSSRRAAPTIT